MVQSGGRLAFTAGDYLYLPRGTMWRLAPREGAAILMIPLSFLLKKNHPHAGGGSGEIAAH